VPLTNAAGDIKAWCGAMPFLRNADLPSTARMVGVSQSSEPMRPSEQEDEPLIAGVKSLYAQLFSEFAGQGNAG